MPAGKLHARGLTLIELILSIAATGIICTAIATVLVAVTYGTDSSKDMRTLVSRNKTVNARLGATIRGSQSILASGSNYIVLWKSDDDMDGEPCPLEMQRLEFATVNDTTGIWSYEAGNPAAAVDEPEGKILRERWDGIGGTSVADLTNNSNYPGNPSYTEMLTRFEGPTDVADAYGQRIRGFLFPPENGEYKFWVAADDNCELWLSPDENAVNKVKIAFHTDWTSSQEWTKYVTQESSAITLQAGEKYYIEALMKEGTGGDNLAVAWQGPGISRTVINGSFLAPPGGASGGASDEETPYPLTGTNFESLTNTLKSSGVIGPQLWAGNVAGLTFTLDNPSSPQDARLVSYRIQMQAGDIQDVAINAVSVRND